MISDENDAVISKYKVGIGTVSASFSTAFRFALEGENRDHLLFSVQQNCRK